MRLLRELATGDISSVAGVEGAVFAMIDGRLRRIDLASGSSRELALPGVHELLASPDGRWIAAGSSAGLVLLDSSGERIAAIGAGWSRPRAWSADSSALVAMTVDEALAIAIPRPSPSPSPPSRSPAPSPPPSPPGAARGSAWSIADRRPLRGVLDAGISGGRLVALTGLGFDGSVVERSGQAIAQPVGAHRDFGLSFTRGEAVIAGRTAGTIVVLYDRPMELRAPIADVRRLVSAPHSRFVVAAVPGRLLVWDLDALLPRRTAVAEAGVLQVAGGHEVLLGDGARRWQWLDVDTGATTPFVVPFGPYAAHASERGGLVALLSDPRAAKAASAIPGTDAAPGKRAMSNAPGIPEPRGASGDPAPSALLIARANPRPAALRGELTGLMLLDDRAVAGTAEGAVLEIELAKPAPTSLVERPSAVTAVAAAGAWRSARFADGTLWRRRGDAPAEQMPLGSLAAGDAAAQPSIERGAPGHDGRALVTLQQDGDGRVCTSAGARLQCWEPSGVAVTLATLPRPIQRLARFGPWFIAALGDGSVYRVSLDGVRIEAAPLSGSIESAARADAGGDDLIASRQPDGSVAILDVIANAAWRLPLDLLGSRTPVALSRDGTRLSVLVSSTLLYTWHLELPRDAAATARWLETLTNATEQRGPGRLQWR